MEWLTDALKDLAIWAVAVVGTVVAYIFSKVHDHATRIAMLEQSVKRLPDSIDEIKEMIEQMREESSEHRAKLYERIEDLRLEVKNDINRESDKRKPPWN